MRADGPRWSAARCAIPDIQVRSDHPRVGFRRASIEYRIAECGSHSRKMFHNMPYANQCYLPDKSRLGPTRGGSNSPPGDAWGPGGAGTSQPAFQMRRRANAALATDQAARKPARMMSATFQASLFLGPRCGVARVRVAVATKRSSFEPGPVPAALDPPARSGDAADRPGS